MFVQFHDMHSHGYAKETAERIYIETVATEEECAETEARNVFFAKYGHNADRVTCTCCGPDYSATVSATLEEASEYERTKYDYSVSPMRVKSVESLIDYLGSDKVAVWFVSDITDTERNTKPVTQGYVWA